MERLEYPSHSTLTLGRVSAILYKKSENDMDIIMYSIPGCDYCSHAKELFRRSEVEYTQYIVGRDLTKSELLKKYPLAHGYPYIIIDGEPIVGGLVATAKLFVEKGLIKSKK